MTRKYTVSDGKLVLVLQEADEGGYVVTSALDFGELPSTSSGPEPVEGSRAALGALKDNAYG
jgi:hypothetical protein